MRCFLEQTLIAGSERLLRFVGCTTASNQVVSVRFRPGQTLAPHTRSVS